MPEQTAWPAPQLADVISEALEQVAFVDVFEEAAAGEAVAGASQCVVAHIELHAPWRGTMRMFIPTEDAIALASDAWGEDVDEEQSRGFLGELANIVAGQLLAQSIETDSTEIGCPEVESKADALANLGDWKKFNYDLEGLSMVVALKAA